MAFRNVHGVIYKKEFSPREGTIMNVGNSIKSGSLMRNTWFCYFCTGVALQCGSELWCTEWGPPVNQCSLQCSSSSSSSAHSWAHMDLPCGLTHTSHHMPDEKPKSNFRVCCSHSSPAWIWLFSCKQDPFLSQAWRGGMRYCDYPLRKKNFLFFIPSLPVTGFRSSFQSKEIFKSQVLQEGWNSSL